MKKVKNKLKIQNTGIRRYIQIVFKIILWLFVGLIAFFIVYGIVAFFTSRITVEGKNDKGEKVQIYLMQSGVHTDFLVPIKNEEIDWTEVFPRENTKLNDTLNASPRMLRVFLKGTM